MQSIPLEQPCRNFNILGIERITDPLDGREKVVLSNFASGSIGNIILLDPITGAGESLALPGDNGAWAVLNLNNEKLLVGTCPDAGYLHCLDLARREWLPPLRDPNELYIWNLALGSDGMVYGGTYPGCVLLRYDPARHVLDNLGRVSDDTGDMYSRNVYGGVPGHLLIAVGYAQPRLILWEIATGQRAPFGKPGATMREINERFICTDTQGVLDFYNPTTFEPLSGDFASALQSKPVPRYAGTSWSVQLSDGAWVATRGQQYYVDGAGAADAGVLRPIPTPRPPTRIHTLAADAHGNVWGSAAFGQTIFRYNPTDGEVWNSEVVCDGGGEVYGMVFVGERLFMTAYAGGDHAVYDSRLPWNQVEHINPRALESVAPALIRPDARSVIGPDGNVWTGWWAGYGVYGGGITCVDVNSMQVTRWLDPAGAQSLHGLAADARYLYFITTGRANGLPEKREPLHFVVWSADGEVVWQREFDAGTSLHGVAACAGRVVVALDQQLQVFDPAALVFERTIGLDAPCNMLLAWGDHIAAFSGKALWRVNPLTGDCARVCELPGEVHAACLTPAGDLFFACGTMLYRLAI